MTGTQKEKKSLSLIFQFNQCKSKNMSENDLKAVKCSVHLHNEKKYALSTLDKNKNGSKMTQMERIKASVRVKQSRWDQFLLKIHLEPMEISLHKTCVTFKQKKKVV